MSVVDNDVLIELVKRNPTLWKTTDKSQKNKMLVKKIWDDMQAKVFPTVPVDDLKKRWKNLKDQYRKELKRIPQSSPGVPLPNFSSQWRYFEPLSFLKDEFGPVGSGDSTPPQNETQNTSEQTQNDLIEPIPMPEAYELEIDEDFEPVFEEQISTKSDEEFEPQTQPNDSRKRPIQYSTKNIREEMVEIERKKLKLIEEEVKRSNMEKSDNYHFLMSLLPELEKLPALQKMRFRTKVTTALIEELTSAQQSQMPQQTVILPQYINTEQGTITISQPGIKVEPSVTYS